MLSSYLPFVALSLCSVASANVDDIISTLGSSLSSAARVLTPDHEDFTSVTHRWDSYTAPQFGSAVEVTSEEDVAKVVQYANEHSLPFLAVNGGHGTTTTFKDLTGGIGIILKKMNGVKVHGDTATIQGGAIAYDITNRLWEQGKQTVQPIAECTGFMGPALGGGRSALQSKYGLAVDNILSARVVLADGSVITASADSHPDLFWGLRGAGHNFGIVTEVEMKVYDVDVTTTWYHETVVFLPHQIVPFAEQLFKLADNIPAPLSFAAVLVKIPPVDPVNPVMVFTIMFDGSGTDADPYMEPFRLIRPIPFINGTIPYVNLASALQQGINDDLCVPDGRRRIRLAAEVTGEKDPAAVLAIYNEFNKTISEQPGFAMSTVIIEGHPMHAAMAVPLDSTAVPFRGNSIMGFPAVTYTDPTLDAEAVLFGERIRAIFKTLTKQTQYQLYVNQAWGDESLDELYGHDAWRLEKLKAVKKEYDPLNRFRFYAPIPSGASETDEKVKDEL